MTLWLIPFFPLLGFLINGLFGKRFSKPIINIIGVGTVAASFAYVVWTLWSLFPIDAPQ